MPDETKVELAPGVNAPLVSVNTLVVGTGAAALNCAVHLYQFFAQKGVEKPEEIIAIATDGLGLGASRFSGSDKQTYYKMGTSADQPDTPRAFAETLTAGGCMHGDLALIEAVNSLREFYHLVDLGVPFPHTPEGGYIGYKTDHDPLERGTSAGPKTSQYMFEVLHATVKRYGIPIYSGCHLLSLISGGDGGERKVVGAIVVDKNEVDGPHHGLRVFSAENVVLGTGGPGALYKTSVYPTVLRGNYEAAFRAGAAANNLTESQFGLASTSFRWNLSGTYQQVIPRYFSTDEHGGDTQEFLNPYFPSMRTLATDIFLKGYQWPFDPQKIENRGSSLIDVLVYYETVVRGRRVFMDFTRNPVATGDMTEFSLSDLESEARQYLEKSGALQDTPIERLEAMNPLSIELYREHDIDITREPLEVAVCSQHNNGGLVVNAWWETTVKHLFAVGEVAGTHGVKRPGGAALNATQVGSLRAAEYIANRYNHGVQRHDEFRATASEHIAAQFDRVERFVKGSSTASVPVETALDSIEERMTTYGAHVRSLDGVAEALGDGHRLWQQIEGEGVRFAEKKTLIEALHVANLALTHVAFLEAIQALLERGSGSRGSHMVMSPDGIRIHPDLGPEWRFLPENESLRDEVVEIRMADDSSFEVNVVPVRPIPEREYWFETMWAEYLKGTIFDVP